LLVLPGFQVGVNNVADKIGRGRGVVGLVAH